MKTPKYIRVNGQVYERVAFDPGTAQTLFRGVMKGLGSLGGKLKKPDKNMLSYLDEYIGDLEKVRNMLGQKLFKQSLK